MNLKNRKIILTGNCKSLDEIRAVLEQKGALVNIFSDKKECCEFVKSVKEIDDLIIIDMPLPAYRAANGAKDEKLWDEVMDYYVRDTYLLAQKSAPKMVKGGNIILAYSCEAFVTEGEYIDAYTIAAGTERTVINVLAQKLGKVGIAVKGIALAQGGAKDKLRFPLGNGNDAITLGETLGFLCSKDAAYISGNTLIMDGGNHLAYRRYQMGK